MQEGSNNPAGRRSPSGQQAVESERPAGAGAGCRAAILRPSGGEAAPLGAQRDSPEQASLGWAGLLGRCVAAWVADGHSPGHFRPRGWASSPQSAQLKLAPSRASRASGPAARTEAEAEAAGRAERSCAEIALGPSGRSRSRERERALAAEVEEEAEVAEIEAVAISSSSR